MNKTLIFKNKKAEDMGLKIVSLPPIQLSTEKIEEKEIDGRDGDLTEFKGYQSDTKSVECVYIGKNPLKLLEWLQGEGDVVFGDIGDRCYKSRINNVVPISQIIENKMYGFTIQFKCQPFGYLLDSREPIILTSSTTLNHNKATYYSLPTLTINGSGACTFTINNRTFNIKPTFNGSITINSFLQEVTSDNGELMTGDFPYLDVGENNVSWSGNITSVEITPHWRTK